MASFLEYLRQQNIFGSRPPIMIGNDLPSQGGITGRMPTGPSPMPRDIMSPGVMTGPMDFPADPTQFMPPPRFDAASDYLTNLARESPIDFGASTDITRPPTPGMDISQFTKPIPNPDEMDAGARMRELYQPETRATDRFNRMVEAYPQAQNPSWLRRLGAMIVDYTKGQRAGQEFFNEPQDRAVADWKTQIGPAQQAANLERYENVNQRTLAYNQIAAELREKAQIAKERNDTRNAEIRQQRADIYSFKARNPGWKIMPSKGGNIMLYNPATGESKDSGIPTGSLTELDKIELMGEQRLDQIEATGAQARQTETTRQAGRETIAETRGWRLGLDQGTGQSILYNEITGETKPVSGNRNIAPMPTGAASRPESPTQSKVRQYNAARQLVNSSPALGRFVELGQGNEFTIAKPGDRGGPTPQEYSSIISAIYGSTPTGMGGRGAGAGPGPTTLQTPPKAPPGWKYVPKPGGGWTAVKDTSQEQF